MDEKSANLETDKMQFVVDEVKRKYIEDDATEEEGLYKHQLDYMVLQPCDYLEMS